MLTPIIRIDLVQLGNQSLYFFVLLESKNLV